jgi:hypothetical protein
MGIFTYASGCMLKAFAMLRLLPWTGTCKDSDYDEYKRNTYRAAERGHLQVLIWLHEHGYNCTTDAFDSAAGHGRLEVLQVRTACTYIASNTL